MSSFTWICPLFDPEISAQADILNLYKFQGFDHELFLRKFTYFNSTENTKKKNIFLLLF